MEEIAARAKVHRTTVSMALRDHPKLPAATRERIKAIAREMGYIPNPLVSALMRYRAGRRSPNFQGEIAYFTNEQNEQAWQEPLAYQKVFSGARQRAEEIGFHLVPLWLRQPGMTARRLNKILFQRGIHAAIVSPQLGQPASLDWVDWTRISAVAVGYSLQSPHLHRVAHDYFHAMTTAVENTLALGFRRPGLILSKSADARADHLWLGSWFAMKEQHPELLPPLVWGRPNVRTFAPVKTYLRRHRPDALCVLPNTKFETLLPWSGKLPCPRRISLGCYDLDHDEPGIYQNYELIGRVAVDQVTGALFRSERGVPRQSHDTLVRGIWSGKIALEQQTAGRVPIFFT